MVRIAGEIVIDRPVAEVFDVVADSRNEPRYNPRMLRAWKVSPGPVGPGTRFVAEMASRGRPLEMTVELTGYERPRRLASHTSAASMDVTGALTFDPVMSASTRRPDGGTRMRWSWDLRLRGLSRLMTPFVAPVGRRQERAIWAGLKRLLEARGAPAVNPDAATGR